MNVSVELQRNLFFFFMAFNMTNQDILYTPFAPVMLLPENITFEQMKECVHKQDVHGLLMTDELPDNLDTQEFAHVDVVSGSYKWYDYSYNFELEN